MARAVSIGRAMARFFGTSSPKSMVSTVLSASAIVDRDRVHRASGTPGGRQRPVDQLGDRGLGEEADGQVGDGDPDLGAGQLRRQGAQRLLDAAAPASPAAAARSTWLRSTVTKANSAATKTPQATISSSAVREEQPLGHECGSGCG